MKKVLYTIGLALLAVSCTEDFKDWANPFKNDPEAAKSMSMSINPVGTIDLATVTADTIQIFSPTITIEDEAETTYQVVVYGPEGSDSKAEFAVDAKGNVPKAALETAVYALYGQRPVKREIPMDVSGYVKVGGQTFKAVGNTTLSVIPNAPEIEAAYYLTGTLNEWNNSDKTYQLTNDGSDPYENPVYTCRIPAPGDGSDIEFKMTPESGIGGDWSKCLAAGDEGKFKYNNDGGNFVIKAVAGAKFYDLTFDMLDQTWSYSALSFDPFVFFIGATDGWASPDQKLASQGEGVYTGYVYVADPNGWGLEFKFQKRAGDWADDSQLNSNNLTAITGDFEKGSDNIKASAGEGVYYVTLDLSANTLNAIKVTKMGIIGDFNGWSGDVEMTWNATDYCFEATGAGVTANGWKFRVNADWAINLGSNDSAEPSAKINDLVANGKNIGVAGSTIKLYPTRKTSETIYCTVE